jgi:hypothetical protein
LDATFFSFVSSKGKSVEYDMVYNKEEVEQADGSFKTQNNKKSVRLTLR